MSEHADRALQSVSGSFTDPAHRLAAAQVHATLAVAEAISVKAVVGDALRGSYQLADPRPRAWEILKEKIATGKTGWGKNELAQLMAECLGEAITSVNG